MLNKRSHHHRVTREFHQDQNRSVHPDDMILPTLLPQISSHPISTFHILTTVANGPTVIPSGNTTLGWTNTTFAFLVSSPTNNRASSIHSHILLPGPTRHEWQSSQIYAFGFPTRCYEVFGVLFLEAKVGFENGLLLAAKNAATDG